MRYLILLALLITSCVNLPVEETKSPARIALYWEKTTSPHPERVAWSDAITSHFRANLALYKQATDIALFCPSFIAMKAEEQVKALGELWSWVSYFESGWNPKAQSVDVGIASDRDTWSTGLYQMSQAYQKNYALPLGYTTDDLLTPLPNIKLSLGVLKFQMEKVKRFAVPVGGKYLYWAVLHPGGKFDQTKAIGQRVQKYAPTCLEPL